MVPRLVCLLITATALSAPVTAQCTYTFSQSSFSVPPAGTSTPLTFEVTTQPGCDSTPSSGASWISVNNQSLTTGSRSVSFAVAVNSEITARTGSVFVAGRAVSIAQSADCTFKAEPEVIRTNLMGAEFRLIPSAFHCRFTVTTSEPWISIRSVGSGWILIVLDFQLNTGLEDRIGFVRAGGQTVRVIQTGNPCDLQMGMAAPAEGIPANDGTFDLLTRLPWNGYLCEFPAYSQAPWMTLSRDKYVAGTGFPNPMTSIPVKFARNQSTSARGGYIRVARKDFFVPQLSQECHATTSLTNIVIPTNGGTAQFDVTALCPWTATATDSWVQTVMSPSTGRVFLTVPAYTGTTVRLAEVWVGRRDGTGIPESGPMRDLTGQNYWKPRDRRGKRDCGGTVLLLLVGDDRERVDTN